MRGKVPKSNRLLLVTNPTAQKNFTEKSQQFYFELFCRQTEKQTDKRIIVCLCLTTLSAHIGYIVP